EGAHSGDGTGVIAASERVIRVLLDRLDDSHTGQIKLAALSTQIPRQRVLQAERTAQVIGEELFSKFPLQPGVEPVTRDLVELTRTRAGRPGLALTGADGWPPIGNAGTVLRPFTRFKLSIRTPPRVDPAAATAAVKQALESDPPYGAKVTFTEDNASSGWD